MLYSFRRARLRASIRAVLPEPTGLEYRLAGFPVNDKTCLPSNANGEAPVLPVPVLNEGHFSVYVRARTVKDLVGVTMSAKGIIVGMGDAIVVGVRVRHFRDSVNCKNRD